MRDNMDDDGDVIMSYGKENHNRGGNVEQEAELSRCPDCGVEVPALNMELHKLRACRGKKRAPAAAAASATSSSSSATTAAAAAADRDNTSSSASSGGFESWTSGLSALWGRGRNYRAEEGDERKMSAATGRRGKQQQSAAGGDDGEVLEVGDVIDLAGSDDEVETVDVRPAARKMASAPPRERDVSTSSTATSESSEADDKDEWACALCTLLNPASSNVCAACNHKRPDNASSTTNGVRSPDAVRRERLIDASPLSPGLLAALAAEDSGAASGSTTNSPLASMSSGALLGSVLGAAGAYAQGGRVRDGALQGALSGAVGAALINELMGSSPAVNTATPLRNASGGGTNVRTTPRSSAARNIPVATNGMRVVRYMRTPDGQGGFVTTMYDSNNGAGGGNMRQQGNDAAAMAMLHTLFRSPNSPAMLGSPGNVDGMSYERLLEMFGDGSENRGADEGDIQALPTSTVGELSEDLSEEARKCSICLEEFKKGDSRRTLPCLHGFHEQCVDSWLRTNATCPICKHSIGH